MSAYIYVTPQHKQSHPGKSLKYSETSNDTFLKICKTKNTWLAPCSAIVLR